MLLKIICFLVFTILIIQIEATMEPAPTYTKENDNDNQKSDSIALSKMFDGENNVVAMVADSVLETANKPIMRTCDADDPSKCKTVEIPFQDLPIFHATTPRVSWVFMTVNSEEFARYLEKEKLRSKVKEPKVDVQAVVTLVKNLTNDYDNVNFVDKLNKSLLRMNLPACPEVVQLSGNAFVLKCCPMFLLFVLYFVL